ncbi:putative adhesion G protein-coupled receptor E4P [Gavia stellata]|uniref:putative adhesion G protein-coupled receptor E4P n=1 Tax=Gavia stellata TaxID=37040 RepID=UPI00289A83A9|nr:putative adhesion G protein-coupled receptor E4P [Gavia stellata]
MVPVPQNSSTISCQAFGPGTESTCNIPVLEEVKRACGDPKGTQQLLKAACARPTERNLQAVLQNLRKEAIENLNSNSTKLLLLSTEALVLQAALNRPGSGPQNFSTSIMEAVVEVVRDDCPQTPLVLAVGEENLTISCREVVSNTQAGNRAVAFIVYKDAEDFLSNITELRRGKLNSRVVSGTVGKPGVTFNIAFNMTLQHLTALQAGKEPRCVSWQKVGTKGRWTPSGCTRVGGDAFHSICTCTHFSTFAILMAIHPITESFALMVVTYVGMSVSLVCLFLAIITFLLCRSLWSVSVTLHLQLSICLFAADLLFLVAVPHTANKLACAVTAGFLHYLFLACFAWMFLEGLHLFLTIRNLRVLNYTSASRFRKRYIYPVGYGTPAIVVAVSATVHPSGYGTEDYCWLSMEEGFIWSFLGPVCVIILVNLLFFLTTLWMLRDKLTSLNADVTALKNTRLMTFKALAQICILGCTWCLGLLQAQGDNIVVAFVFTIVNSLQGAFIFLVHCVLNRQVTEQYRRWFRALGRRPQHSEMPTTEIHVTYVTEGERPHSHSTEGCVWEN